MDDLWMWLVMLVIGSAMLMGTCTYNDYRCEQIHRETGLPTKYRFSTGCYVKVNGRWTPEQNWRTTDE